MYAVLSDDLLRPFGDGDVRLFDGSFLREGMLTPDVAQLLFDEQHTSQRVQAPSVVKRYATDVTDDNWILTPQALSVDVKGKLVDGGHRCAAVLKSGVGIPVRVFFDVPEYVFEALDGGRPRQARDFIENPHATLKASVARVMLAVEEGDRRISPTSIRGQKYTRAALLGRYHRTSDIKFAVEANGTLATQACRTKSTRVSFPAATAPSLLVASMFLTGDRLGQWWKDIDDIIHTRVGKTRGHPLWALREAEKHVSFSSQGSAFSLCASLYAAKIYREGGRLTGIHTEHQMENLANGFTI